MYHEKQISIKENKTRGIKIVEIIRQEQPSTGKTVQNIEIVTKDKQLTIYNITRLN